MNRNEILEKVKEVICNLTGEEIESVEEDSRITEDLGMDSLDKVEFIMDLETEFDINIPDEDAEEVLIVKEVVDYLTTKLY